jgi:hypothetical protein
MANQIEQIGRAFVQHYYTTFDKDRSQLGPLYQADSLLTFEGQSFQGADQIVAKFKDLKFGQIAHVVKSCDCAPSAAGILVFVTGDLKVEGEANALKFGQVFLLLPTAPNSQNFYVRNDVFRLNYG